MEKCPVCRAKHSGKKACHRCKTDLTLFLDVEKEAVFYRNEALRACGEKRFDEMFDHALRSHRLKGSEASLKLVSCAAVLAGRFREAFLLQKKSI